ncbi:cadherin-like domain-containing protein, partial [Pseudomonas sp. G34]|uniref:Ig-like domain-containing protein n=1 Tax=Pseudomonas sp. G34 TaxID=3059083 RepID=UPI00280732E3
SISTTDAAGNVGTASDTEGYSVDITAPAITVDAPAVSNDTTPTITGTTDAPVGSTVTLTITQGSTVTTVTTPVLAGGTYTVDVPQALAEGPYSVEAQVTDPAGNTGNATDNGAIDTLAGDTGAAPVVTITEDANNDGIISKAELNGPVDVRVGLPAGAVAGDTLVITNGTTPQTVTLTAAQITAGFVTTTFPSPGEGNSITVEATLRDQFGNTSEKGSDTAKVDTLAGTTGAAPVVTITEDANNDGVISKAELNGEIDVRVGLPAGAVAGDTLLITNGTTPQTVTLTAAQITAGFVTTTFANPGEGNTLTVEATLLDQFGNTSEKGTDTAKVDTLAGTTGAAPVVTITEDANNDGVISKAELNGEIDVRVGLPAGAVAGDTLVITNGTTPQTITLTAAQISAGFVTTTFPNPGEGNTLTVEATLRDQFGNTSEKGTDTAKVDTLAGTTGAAPVVTITEDANNDGIISKAELNGPVDVRVGLPAGAVAGDTLVITNGTTPQTVTLTAAQITAGFVTTTFANPGEGNSITVEATLRDQFGNTSEKGTDTARVDTLAGTTGAAPVVTITEDANNDGVISKAELNGTVDVRVGLPAGAVAGDTLVITNGTTPQTITLTAAQITAGFVTTTFANPGEGNSITVEATLRDQFGNTSEKGTDTAKVDTLAGTTGAAPVVTITEDANNDGVISKAELNGPVDVRVGLPAGAVAGDTLVITNGTTPQTITLTAAQITAGFVTTTFPSPGEGNTLTVDAVLKDQFGNTSEKGTDTAKVDTLAGTTGAAPVVTITEDANNDGIISKAELNGPVDVRVGLPAGAVAGDTLVITNGTTPQTITLTAAQIATGYVDTTFPSPGEGNTLTVEATLRDQFGNTSEKGTDTAKVDTLTGSTGAAPVVTITEDANNDGIISKAELNGPIDVRVGLPAGAVAGDTLVITNGTTPQTVTLTAAQITAGFVTTTFPSPGEGNTLTVEATLQDQFGNTSEKGTDTAKVDTLAGTTGAAPVVTITEDANNDGIISKAELNGPVDVRVGLPAGAVAGDTLVITNGTTPQTVTLTAAQITAGFVTTTFANPGEGNTLTVEATLRDQFGNTSEKGTDTAKVDTLAGTTGAAPVVTITEDANNDGVISKAELNGEIDVRVGLPAGAVAGDTISITSGTVTKDIVLTAEQVTAGQVGTTFPSPGEGQTITVDAVLKDQFGNTSEKGTDTAKVDTLAGTTGAAPVVTITEDANNDGIISKAELNGPVDVRVGLPAGAVAGDTLVITNGTTPQTVTLTAAQITAGFVTTTFPSPGEGNTLTVEATLQDQFGNTSNKGTDSARVDTLAGATGAAPTVEIREDINNDGVIGQNELSGAIDVRVGLPAGSVAGDTLSVTDGTTIKTFTLTAAQITTGYLDTTFAPPGEGKTIVVDATLQDQFGNTSSKGSDQALVNSNPVAVDDPVGSPYTVQIGDLGGAVTSNNWALQDSNNQKIVIQARDGNGNDAKLLELNVDGNQNALGVDGSPRAVVNPVPDQLEFDPTTGKSESITLNFSGNLNQASFSVSRLVAGEEGGEVGRWVAMYEGVEVASGTFKLGTGGAGTFSLNTGTQVFDSIRFEALPTVNGTGDGSDYFLTGFSGSGPASANSTYVVNESQTLVIDQGKGLLNNDSDAQANQTLNVVKINGADVPANGKVVLAKGVLTVNVDGSFNFAANDNNLKSGEIKTQSFTYTVSDGYGGTATANATITIIGTEVAPGIGAVSAAVDSTGGQVDEGDNAVFTVSLTNASSTASTFSLSLNPGTATAGNDYNAALTNQSFSNGVTYNATTGQVTVPAGVTSFTVTVPTINDTVSEPTETFSLTVGGKTGTATIIDNDAAPTVSTVSSAVDSTGGQVDEGDNAVFTVNLTNASSTPTTFSLALNAGTATAGSDYNAALTNQSFSNGVTYNATTGQVTVPAGVTSFTVTVPTINDTVNEPTENFSLTVGGKTGTATIIDNDPVPTVKTIDVGQAGTADDNVVEGNNLVFNVTLSNASSTPTVLAFNATGTATANVDYKLTAQSFSNGVTYDASTGKITVPAGVTSFSVTVQTLADNVVAEPLETVRLDIGGQSATGGIIDGTPDAKDDSYTKVTGLKAEYYGYNDASTGAGNDGANLTNLSQVRQFIDSHNPAATFNATKLDYGTLSNASGLGNGTNLQNFLGVDVASGNGAKANSLSTDPGNSSDAIIKMAGYINLAAGTYQFKVTADDGYSIRINGQVVAEFNNIQSTSTATGKTFTISAAQAGAQQIEIIYWDQGGDARLKVELGQGGTFKVVDSDMLYHIPGTSNLVVESGESLTVAGSTLLGNDTDPNGDALSITSVQNATNGTVTLNNGNVIFTPKAGFYGDASFQYSVSDGKGGSDTATVTLKVNQAANVIHVAGDGSNDNGDNTIRGGAGNDVLLGDAGGTLTTVQPATNYNIALLVDTSGSMQGDRMSLTKSALSNFAKTLAGHDGVVNLTLVGFAGDVTLSARVADLQNGTKLDGLLADIQRLTANGGTNYEAAFKEASAWFDAQSAAGNTKAAGYENLTFFLSDGDPTFYYNGNTTTVSGNGSTTNDQVLLGSLDTFNVLAGKSAVQAIGIGSGVSEKNLSLFDNTTDSPAFSYLANGSGATLANFNNDTTGWNNLGNWDITGTGFFSGSAGRNSDALMIRDTAGGSPVTATTPTLTIAEGTLSTLRFAYGTADTGNGDSLSWKLQQLVQGVWTDVQSGGGTTAGNWTTAETSVVGAGTYRLAFTVDDKSNNLANATMWIDNISRVDYTKVPVGKVEIVNSADELSVALHGGSNAHVPVTVGNDTIHGGDGNDIIFGDVINTDGLKWGVDGNPTKPTDLHDGAGVKALETFLELKNGIAPTNGDLYDYIRANHETFNVAGDTRGGADQLYGGGGNDILYGQGGNDLLVGGAGDDILFGGAGADTFAWQKGDFGKDVIKDFNVAEGDTIDLSSLLQDHSNNLDSYLKLVTDNGSSTLLISTKGEFNTADTSSQQVAAKADVQIDLGQASLPSYDINSLIANHTIKVDP